MTNLNPTTVVHEHKVTTEHNDVMDVGVFRVNDDERAVAYAALGDTTVSIYRGADGKVRIEIDDPSEEDVHISVNCQYLVADPGPINRDLPWHYATDASAQTFTRQ